jgi:photosystem II stability/assembly factor-like uncharacterized protein
LTELPRIELFTRAEKRRAAIVAFSAVAVIAGSVAYLRPPARATVAAAPAAAPSAVVAGVTAASASTAYVLTVNADDRQQRTLYRTDDGGQSWQHVATPAGGGFFGAQVLSGGGDVVVTAFGGLGGGGFRAGTTGSGTIWLSRDHGRRWARVAFPDDGNFARATVIAAVNRWYLLSTGESGLIAYLSSDEGAHWQTLFARPEAGELAGARAFEAAAGAYWLLADSRLLRSGDGGVSWQPVTVPAAGGPPVAYMLPQFTSGAGGWMQVYTPSSGLGIPSSALQSWLSTTDDGGLTWSPPRSFAHYPVFTLAGSPDWWATDGTRLYNSRDFGLSWSVVVPELPSSDRLQLVSRATTEVAWNVYSSRVMRTLDAGRHWSEVRFEAG